MKNESFSCGRTQGKEEERKRIERRLRFSLSVVKSLKSKREGERRKGYQTRRMEQEKIQPTK